MKPVIFIPARLGSSRLPRKPLAKIGDKTLIERAVDCAKAADIAPVYVATPDQELVDFLAEKSIDTVLTGNHHETGTDRMHEALHNLDPKGQYDVAINVQGDIPSISPKSIRAVLKPFRHEPTADIGTIGYLETNRAKAEDPNMAKIALELHPTHQTYGRALYFSRSLIPHDRDNQGASYYHHIGLYAYRREALDRFVKYPPSVLEDLEKLEQLRALTAGMHITVQVVDDRPMEVNTPEDLENVCKALL
jgi:3-deoxy-manno-octulosonate cytidylyltransferase (CMP-KDO synthetase)